MYEQLQPVDLMAGTSREGLVGLKGNQVWRVDEYAGGNGYQISVPRLPVTAFPAGQPAGCLKRAPAC